MKRWIWMGSRRLLSKRKQWGIRFFFPQFFLFTLFEVFFLYIWRNWYLVFPKSLEYFELRTGQPVKLLWPNSRKSKKFNVSGIFLYFSTSVCFSPDSLKLMGISRFLRKTGNTVSQKNFKFFFHLNISILYHGNFLILHSLTFCLQIGLLMVHNL